MSKRAFITGITGQDGSYLAELLLSKNYHVHGLIRRSSTPNTKNIEHILNNPNVTIHLGDMTDSASLNKIVNNIKPDEVYNLAAQSHVKVSFDTPVCTGDINAIGSMRLLEACRNIKDCSIPKFYQASSSELFGKIQEPIQNETTPMYPRSPYGVAKYYAYWAVKNYREAYNMFACNGILFNHESPRRGEEFVTRKVTKYVANWDITSEPLELGNLSSLRDWGHAKDYVNGMWLMLQASKPDDYVLSTGEKHSVKELVELCFKIRHNKTILWEGEGIEQKGYVNYFTTKANEKMKRRLVVVVNPDFYRPSEVDVLCGNSAKAEKELNWKRKYTFDRLIKEMLLSDQPEKYWYKNGGESPDGYYTVS